MANGGFLKIRIRRMVLHFWNTTILCTVLLARKKIIISPKTTLLCPIFAKEPGVHTIYIERSIQTEPGKMHAIPLCITSTVGSWYHQARKE